MIPGAAGASVLPSSELVNYDSAKTALGNRPAPAEAAVPAWHVVRRARGGVVVAAWSWRRSQIQTRFLWMKSSRGMAAGPQNTRGRNGAAMGKTAGLFI